MIWMCSSDFAAPLGKGDIMHGGMNAEGVRNVIFRRSEGRSKQIEASEMIPMSCFVGEKVQWDDEEYTGRSNRT